MSSLRAAMYGGLISREISFLVTTGAAGKLPFFATGGDTVPFGSFDS